MTTKIKLKKSSVASNAPGTGDLDYGELAINYADGRLYYKNSSNIIKNFIDSDQIAILLSGISGSGTVTSVSATVPTGFTISGSPVTSSGTLAISYDTGYQGYTTTEASKLAGIEENATADQTASEILTLIKTVDGSGSGLDADTLDGVQGSNFLRSDVSDEAAVIEFQGGVTYTPPAGGGSDTATDVGIALTTGTRIVGAYGGYIRSLLEWNSSNDIVIGQNGTTLITGINLLPGGSGDAKVNGNKIWHAGNDGSGSGLDADLWDGNQFSSYLNQAVLTSSSPTFTGLTVNNGAADGGNISLSSLGFNTWNIDNNSGSFRLITNSVVPYQISAAGTHAFRDTSGNALATILSTGNVGIGTSSPVAKFDVYSPEVGESSGDEIDHAIIRSAGGQQIRVRDIRHTDGASWDTTETRLHYSVNDNSSKQMWISFYNEDGNTLNNIMRFGEGETTEWMRIDNGNVGIGTSSPSEKLSVSGNISVTGTVDGRDVAADGTKLDGIEAGATADQTASEILTAIKTVDGSGSGLDADTLDGVQGSSFLRSDTTDSFTGTITNSGEFHSFYNDNAPGTNLRLGRSTDQYMTLHGGSSGNFMTSVSTAANPKNLIKFGVSIDGGATLSSVYTLNGSSGTIWHTGNDGSGSGLDADTLDGVQGSSFLRGDAAGYKTSGTLRFNDNIYLTFGSGNDFEMFCNGSNMYFDLNSTGVGSLFLRDGTTTRFTFARSTGDFTATGDINSTSDARVKDNVEVIENAVDKVKQISGVTFTRTDKENTERRYAGVIAQEVQKVLPEVIGGDEDNLTVAYGNMVGLLIEAIKEQQKQIEELKGMIQ